MLHARLFVLCIAVPLAACSSLEGSDWSSVYTMAKDYWYGKPPISLDEAAAIPYASIGVRIGDGPQALLVLATESGDDMMWVAGRSAAIETRNGRIVRTSGLDHNLTNYWSDSRRQTFPTENTFRNAQSTTWFADYADMHRYSVAVTCNRAPAVRDPVTILGATIPTDRVDESCTAPDLDWTFVNSFWVDPESQFVWRSLQHIRPDLAPIEIEVLRPPA